MALQQHFTSIRYSFQQLYLTQMYLDECKDYFCQIFTKSTSLNLTATTQIFCRVSANSGKGIFCWQAISFLLLLKNIQWHFCHLLWCILFFMQWNLTLKCRGERFLHKQDLSQKNWAPRTVISFHILPKMQHVSRTVMSPNDLTDAKSFIGLLSFIWKCYKML